LFLLEKFQLFLNNPIHLRGPEYVVRTDVKPQVFSEFIKATEGEQIEITFGNIQGLSGLCSEFGFEELGGRSLVFKRLISEDFDGNRSSEVLALKEKTFQFEKDICLLQAENQRLSSEFAKETAKTQKLTRALRFVQEKCEELRLELRQQRSDEVPIPRVNVKLSNARILGILRLWNANRGQSNFYDKFTEIMASDPTIDISRLLNAAKAFVPDVTILHLLN
jgi:hypothetical protein